MLKIPRSILVGVGEIRPKNTTNIPIDPKTDNTNRSEEEISVSSLVDVEWVTNALEPDQQRGPSETP